MNKEEHQTLFEQCIQGNKSAWKKFIKRYSPLIYYTIQKIFKSKYIDGSLEEIDDLHNEVFMCLMDKNGKKLSQYRGENGCSIPSWIRMITVRITIDYFRKKRKNLVSIEDSKDFPKYISSNTPLPSQTVEKEELKRVVKDFIKTLPVKDQLFLKLLYYEEATPQEIARIFNTSVNAVYSRGNYIREKLKEKLSKEYMF